MNDNPTDILALALVALGLLVVTMVW